ncbi:hypothetical protein ACSS6W_006073 [Trichoderma asperelloides]|nr:hypothetical protein LI328DRAFT_42331 [Trichoderma asperelloides]
MRFPGRSVRLPLAEFNDKNLQVALASFLERASIELIHSLQVQARKVGRVITELRDTSDPASITQMLMAILEAIGNFATVPTLRKRVRDDVNLLYNTMDKTASLASLAVSSSMTAYLRC